MRSLFLTAVAVFFVSMPYAAPAADDVLSILWTAPGEGGLVDQVAFYPGGIYLASSDQSDIKVWDTRTKLLKYRIFTDARALAFASAPALLASASANEITFWNVNDGAPADAAKIVDQGFEGGYRALVFSPGGGRVIAGGGVGDYPYGSGRLTVWSVPGGAQIAAKDLTYRVVAVCIAQGNEPVAAVLSQPGIVNIYRLSDWSLADSEAVDTAVPYALACSLDGKYIVAGGADGDYKGVVTVLQREGVGPGYAPLHTITGPTKEVTSLAMYAYQVIAGSRDKTIRYWSAETGNPIRTVLAHAGYDPAEGGVQSLAFSDNFLLASGGRIGDGALVLRNGGTGEAIRTLNYHRSSVRGLTFRYFGDDDNYLFSIGADKTVRRWNWPDGSLDSAAVFDLNPAEYYGDLSPSGDGAYVLVRRYEEPGVTLKSFSLPYFLDLKELSSGVDHAIFSPDGSTAVAADRAGYIKLYKLFGNEEGLPFKVWQAYAAERIGSLQYSPDGLRLLTVGEESREIKLWNAADGRLEHSFNVFSPDWFDGAVFSPDGSMLAAAGDDPVAFDRIYVWRVSDGEVLHTFDSTGFGAPLFTPDGLSLVAPRGAGVQVWRLSDGAEQAYFYQPGAGYLRALSAAPDARTLAVSYDDNTLDIHLVEDGQQLKHYTKPMGTADFIQYAPKGTVMALGEGDGTVVMMTNPYPPERFFMAINSFGAEGVKITATGDADGQTRGTTPFTLAYGPDYPQSFRAPDKAGGKSFRYWLLDGVQIGISTGLDGIMVQRNRTLTAVYSAKGGDIPPVATPTPDPDPSAPVINKVKPEKAGGYSVAVLGGRFAKRVKLFINDRRWHGVRRISAKKILAGGGAKLQRLVRRRKPALVEVENPDGHAAVRLWRWQ